MKDQDAITFVADSTSTTSNIRAGMFNEIWSEGFGLGVILTMVSVAVGLMVWNQAVRHVLHLIESGTDVRKYYKVEEGEGEDE